MNQGNSSHTREGVAEDSHLLEPRAVAAAALSIEAKCIEQHDDHKEVKNVVTMLNFTLAPQSYKTALAKKPPTHSFVFWKQLAAKKHLSLDDLYESHRCSFVHM